MADTSRAAQGPTVRNFSTHAFEHLHEKLLPALLARGDKADAAALEAIAEHLLRSPKFLLPPGGRYLEIEKFTVQDIEELRAPFPVTVLEFEGKHVDNIEALGRAISSRRIALLYDLSPSDAQELAARGLLSNTIDTSAGGMVLTGVFYADDEAMWYPSSIGIFLPRAQRSPVMDACRRHVLAEVERGRLPPKDKNPFHQDVIVQAFPLLPTLCAAAIAAGATLQELESDLCDEMIAAADLCLALSCSNVGTEVIAAPERLNKARRKKGRQPFSPYRVLVLHPGEESARTPAGTTSSGRASPRQHLRRGHRRRLPSGNVWVRDTVVGDARRGSIAKDYRLESEREEN